MKGFGGRFLLTIAALVFAVGLPLALAVPPALAAECDSHQHHQMIPGSADHHEAPQKSHHHHNAADCICCCIGACVAVPDLPRAAEVTGPVGAATVIYPEMAVAFVGHSLRPDPAPPRSIALN